MDIKGVARNLIPLVSVRAAQEAKAARSKTDANNDRDGNGQASGEEQRKTKLSPEELTDAIKYLEELPGVKENNLTVRADLSSGTAVVYVQDRDGKVVRRIAESELWQLTSNRQKKSGHLLNRAL
jgi:uncharacterized FlaG/YvyC family protein